MSLFKKTLAFVFFHLFIAAIYNQTPLTGKVIAIKDGDTIVVIDNQNNATTLRLAEVDCPEKKQPFGTKAKQFTSNAVYLKTVTYFITNKDRYGRSIAKVYYDNNKKYLSAEIIKNGMGWQYKKYSDSKELAQFEQQARFKKIGLWTDPNPIYPSDWRKAKKVKKIHHKQ